MGLDHLVRTPRLSLEEVSASLSQEQGQDIRLQPPFFLVTYHAATAASEPPLQSFQALLAALEEFGDHQIILTYPNADNGGREIITALEEWGRKQDRCLVVPSLGFARYLAVAARADAVIGNSSSGLIEVPSFHVPTVNIGARQQGRLAADSVCHCPPRTPEIVAAIQKAVSPVFKQVCREVRNPYGAGDAARQIVDILAGLPTSTLGQPSKTFYDLECNLGDEDKIQRITTGKHNRDHNI